MLVAFVSLFCSRVLLSVSLFVCQSLLWISFDRALLSRVLLSVSLFVCQSLLLVSFVLVFFCSFVSLFVRLSVTYVRLCCSLVLLSVELFL